MSYAKYERYKDSGVDWLGKIPSDWDLQPAFKYIKENKTKNTGLLENTVLSLSYGKIIIKPEEKLTGLVPESFETYQIVEPNDIIIRCTDLQNDKVSLRTGLVENRGIITSAYLGLKVFQNYNSKFLHYYLHSLDITKAIYKFGTGLRQNLSFLDFKRLPLVDISLDLQQKIANFLDQKTAQIDQAIALKQQQIEKLGEYKQIVIQNAVTKGLNPNAPMKDGGVAWIGDIPEHWEMVSIKRIAKISPKVDLSNYKLDEKVTFLPMEKVSSNGDIDCEILKPIRKVKQGFTAFKKNDVILAKITPCFENGKGALLDKLETEIGYGSTEFHVLRASKRIKAYYLYLITHSSNFLTLGEAMMTGSAGQKRVPTDFVANYQFPLPPMSEQQQIIEYVENLNRKISDTIQSYQTQIDRLKEYKNILINQAVTGKIKI